MGPRFLNIAALLASGMIASTAGAQVRDRVPAPQPAPAPAAAAPHSAAPSGGAPASAAGGSAARTQTAREGGAARNASAGSHRPVRNFPQADPASFEGNQGVPGLGFDYPHLAAIARAQGRSTNFGGHEHGGQGFITPILFGGYPFYPYYTDDLGMDQQPASPAAQDPELPAQPQPQIIVIQQPVAPPQATLAGNGGGDSEAVAAAVPPEVAVPDRGNFILVRRDGRVLFASLFSVVGTQLQYITPEGIRRTLPMAELDADATEQMNEARGTSIQIRN